MLKFKSILYVLMSIVFIVPSLTIAQSDSKEVIEQKIIAHNQGSPLAADGIELFSQIELPKFYFNRDFELAWTDEKNRNDLLESINASFDEGLSPEDYHLEKISKFLNKADYKELSKTNAAQVDLLMTDALILYASHLISGKVEQSKLRSKWDVDLNPRPDNVDSLLTVTLYNKKIKPALEAVKPSHYLYKLMKFHLKEYREIAKNGAWSKIPEGKTLKKGMSDKRITIIRTYLITTKDLKNTTSSNNEEFDEELEDAVELFQKRHNLTIDGAIGKGTIEQMNVSVEERIAMIRLNLERFRWAFHEPDNDFLMVNIAGFHVKRITNKQEVFDSRVIVGKYHKESPIFKDQMTYIEMNPTWTLPYSIATHETLPKLKKNPNYLSEKNMIIMDRNGKVLDASKIDFNQYSVGNFPFILRQTPGPWNALGEVKFMFPNKYAVYLHDTPSRGLFNRQDRAFSHGCIRTENKWELLMSLMDDPDVWNMDKINQILKSGKTTRITLPKPVNIYIMYWTSRVDQQNLIYFMKDVYKRDGAVLKALNEPVNFKIAAK